MVKAIQTKSHKEGYPYTLTKREKGKKKKYIYIYIYIYIYGKPATKSQIN